MPAMPLSSIFGPAAGAVSTAATVGNRWMENDRLAADRAKIEGDAATGERETMESRRLSGEYIQAQQSGDPTRIDAAFNAIQSSPDITDESKQAFFSLHQELATKATAPAPHPSGLTPAQIQTMQGNAANQGGVATWNEATQTWDRGASATPLPGVQAGIDLRTQQTATSGKQGEYYDRGNQPQSAESKPPTYQKQGDRNAARKYWDGTLDRYRMYQEDENGKDVFVGWNPQAPHLKMNMSSFDWVEMKADEDGRRSGVSVTGGVSPVQDNPPIPLGVANPNYENMTIAPPDASAGGVSDPASIEMEAATFAKAIRQAQKEFPNSTMDQLILQAAVPENLVPHVKRLLSTPAI